MAEGQDIDLDSVIDRLLEGEHLNPQPTQSITSITNHDLGGTSSG